jgi:hypothetical protein
MESVKAPFEFVSASFRRSQKKLSSEMRAFVSILDNRHKRSPEETQEEYTDIEKRITSLLKELDDADVIEKKQLEKIMARCKEYLSPSNDSTPRLFPREDNQPAAAAVLLSTRRELVLIGESLLCRGHLDAVDALIAESGEWLDLLLDVQIYRTAAAVETSVLRGELAEALKWVQDHASKLRRLNSALEFFVRQEQFLEMVYAGKSLEALRFAQVSDRDAHVDSYTVRYSNHMAIFASFYCRHTWLHLWRRSLLLLWPQVRPRHPPVTRGQASAAAASRRSVPRMALLLLLLPPLPALLLPPGRVLALSLRSTLASALSLWAPPRPPPLPPPQEPRDASPPSAPERPEQLLQQQQEEAVAVAVAAVFTDTLRRLETFLSTGTGTETAILCLYHCPSHLLQTHWPFFGIHEVQLFFSIVFIFSMSARVLLCLCITCIPMPPFRVLLSLWTQQA